MLTFVSTDPKEGCSVPQTSNKKGIKKVAKSKKTLPIVQKPTVSTDGAKDLDKSRGRPAGAKTAASKKKKLLDPDGAPIGDSRYPLTQWSLTITKTGCDVPVNLLDIIIFWCRQLPTEKGMYSSCTILFQTIIDI